MADFTQHEPCPGCGSTDGLARYSDGSAHCFVCKKYNERKGGGAITETTEELKKDWTPLEGEPADLPKRGLKKSTLAFWDYLLGDGCQLANYYNDQKELIAQKVRRAGKKFTINGNGKGLPFYGQWLWQGGRHLVITEGEIDALSMSQAQECKYPVVSLPNGAAAAEQSIAEHYDWLNKFDRIVLMFDMDKPGREAAEKAAALLPPGKAAIAVLPEKDANEVLVKHGPGKLVRAFWDAPFWSPDGIVSGDEFTLDTVRTEDIVGYTLPYPKTQEMMLGLRKGELTLLTAGSGIGKSTLARELAYHLRVVHRLKIANVFLEEKNVKTAQGYVAIHNNVPLGRLRHNNKLLTDAQWQDGLTKVVHGGGMYFYNHFGSLESKNLMARLRYFAVVLKVAFIMLDHISIVTSGIESSSEGERKDIDILMTGLQSLIQSTGVGIVGVVHLKRTQGKSFNEGGQVSLNDLRGSASLEQLSDNVIALERDQQVDA